MEKYVTSKLSDPYVEPSSFRDPSGRVYVCGDRIFRTVMEPAVADFEFVQQTGFLERLASDGLTIPAEPVSGDILGALAQGARYVLEHPKLPFISYPYEWPFPVLKAAALLHLEIHLKALNSGITLSDGSAYNIQFKDARPVFIDYLSFRRYRDGEFWMGHRQFYEQFLNPLLLRALLGVPYNPWYRGCHEGISTAELNRLIPLTSKLSWKVLTHVTLQAAFEKSAAKEVRAAIKSVSVSGKFPLLAFQRLLHRLHTWISKLEPADTGKTVWTDYAKNTSYTSAETVAKQEFVAKFAGAVRPRMVWDLGCNTGDYSKVALDAGANNVIGFDSDHGALEAAFARAQAEGLAFLPLFLDAANPTASQGWAEAERRGLKARATADAIFALALVHHIAIGHNIPLERVVDWLIGLAPQGIIEFVQKTDPMVRQMLSLREDIFADYSEEQFLKHITARAQIIETKVVSASGRRLVWFARNC